MLKKYSCGYVAIIGKPNVGKSTLLNQFLQKKISITSNKPETTQKQILGIKTTEDYQVIFVDTPGLHENLYKKQKNILNKYMGRAVSQALREVDLILFVVAGDRWSPDDEAVLKAIEDNNTKNHTSIPVILVVNKADLVKNKEDLFPFTDNIKNKYNFTEIFYTSALKKNGLGNLEQKIIDYLPTVNNPQEFYFESDRLTDQNNRQLTAEIIREKVIRLFGAEVPYSIAIEIENFSLAKTKDDQELVRISAIIWVEKSGQKTIIIGSNGEKIKEVGRSARVDLEKLFYTKVFLQLWVKVKSNWSDNERALKSLGFNSFD